VFTRCAAAALLLVTAAACGGAEHQHAARPASLSVAPVAAQPAAYADRAVFHANAARQQAARARAEQREERTEQRERQWARAQRLQQRARACPPAPAVHFDTADAAMRYLADAWNRKDVAAICAVSTPDARYQLLAMHYEAQHLRLSSCDSQGNGAYMCTFTHDYPARLHRHGHGEMQLIAAPATRTGYYTSGFIGCG
jgi:hypothetical protein